MLHDNAATVADQLFEIGVVKFAGVNGAPKEGFRLKLHEDHPDAPLSPIYLNLRTPENKGGPLTPEIVREITGMMAVNLRRDFDYLIGIPRAGDPIAEGLNYWLDQMWPGHVRLLHLSKTEADDRRQITALVENPGFDTDGLSAVLVDDLITKAHTKLEAIAAVERAGIQVRRLVVIVDREQGGKQELERQGYKIQALFTLSQLLDHYYETGKINGFTRTKVKGYLIANHA